MTLPSFGAISPSQSQSHLVSQPHSPIWNMDDDDDLLSSGQASPVGYGSGYTLGLDSGNEDPRTPKAWANDYLSSKQISSQLGSPFSGSRASSIGRNIPQKPGSEASAQTHSSTSDNVKRIVEAFGSLGKGHPPMRPWPANRIPHTSRISSWSDPVSARDDVQGIGNYTRNSSDASATDEGQESEDRLGKDEEMDMFEDFHRHRRSSTAKPTQKADVNRGGEKPRSWLNEDVVGVAKRSRSRSTLGGQSIGTENTGNKIKSKPHHLEDDIPEEEATTRRMLGLVPRRRRSFHSLSMYRHDADEETTNDNDRRQTLVKVLPIDRMRIDVELCGYYLIMWRRAEHLGNVVATLQVDILFYFHFVAYRRYRFSPLNSRTPTHICASITTLIFLTSPSWNLISKLSLKLIWTARIL